MAESFFLSWPKLLKYCSTFVLKNHSSLHLLWHSALLNLSPGLLHCVYAFSSQGQGAGDSFPVPTVPRVMHMSLGLLMGFYP